MHIHTGIRIFPPTPVQKLFDLCPKYRGVLLSDVYRNCPSLRLLLIEDDVAYAAKIRSHQLCINQPVWSCLLSGAEVDRVFENSAGRFAGVVARWWRVRGAIKRCQVRFLVKAMERNHLGQAVEILWVRKHGRDGEIAGGVSPSRRKGLEVTLLEVLNFWSRS